MGHVKSLDLEVEVHKKYLRRQIIALKKKTPRAGKNYESFLDKLFILFSDTPSVSWRFVVTSYKYPAFRIVNRRTGRTNDFLRVFPQFSMVAITPSVEKKYKKIFPQTGAWYGAGDQVTIQFSTFGEQKQLEFIKDIKSIITSNKDLSLNFAAHA